MSNVNTYTGYQELSSINLTFFEYTLQFEIAVNGEERPIPITEYVNSAVYHQEFESHLFAWLEVDAVLPYKIMQIITEHPDDIYIVFNMKKHRIESDDEEPWRTENFDNIVLKPIDLPTNRLERPANSGEDQLVNIPSHPIKLYLFKKDTLNVNKATNEGCYSKHTITDVITDLVNKNCSKSNNKLYIGSVANPRVYENIMLPPDNFSNTLSYIQKNYGIYPNGASSFFTFSNTFIMDANSVITGTDPKSTITNVDLEIYPKFDKNRSESSTREGCWYDEQGVRYLVRTSNYVKVSNNAGSTNELLGESIKFISNNQNNKGVLNCFKTTSKDNDPDCTKEVTYYNPTSNPMIETEMLMELKRNKQPITMTLSNLDIEIFSINKLYKIHDMDLDNGAYLDGVYKLFNCLMLFLPNSGRSNSTGRCKVDIACIFKKVDELEAVNGTDTQASQTTVSGSSNPHDVNGKTRVVPSDVDELKKGSFSLYVDINDPKRQEKFK